MREAARADLARAAKKKGLEARKSPGGLSHAKKKSDSGKSAADTRWVLTRKMADGVGTVEARSLAKAFQDPDLGAGVVETSRFASPLLSPSGYLPEGSKKWGIWNLDIGNASLKADAVSRDVVVRAPDAQGPSNELRY